MCPEMRLREGPRVMGDYRLTRDDVSVGQEFPDVIGKSHFKAGAHHTVDKNTIAQVEKVCPNDDGSYDIPYRCLVPKTVENLLVAGKCVSTDRDAYLRYLHQTMVTGQETKRQLEEMEAEGVALDPEARRGGGPVRPRRRVVPGAGEGRQRIAEDPQGAGRDPGRHHLRSPTQTISCASGPQRPMRP